MKKALLLLLLIQSLMVSQNGKGTIAGNLRSLDGSPAVGIRVAAAPVNETAPAAEISSFALTDGAGNFRLENLQPGSYRVFAGLLDFPTYFPGVTAAGISPIVSVTAGASVADINFSMLRPANLPANLKVSGHVTIPVSATPSPRPGRVGLLQLSINGRARVLDSTIQPDGTFEFANVQPGTYTVAASVANTTLKEPVVINVEAKDVTGIELTLLNRIPPATPKGLEQVWSVTGSWLGIASDEKAGMLYATKPGARRYLEILDSAGKTIRETPIPGAAALRRATFSKGQAFLPFGSSSTVNAYDDQGKLLWSYPAVNSFIPSTVINDATAVDLDGDGNDEVVVGFRGDTGIHVLNGQGEVLWKSNGISNVRHVSAGDVRGNGKPQVIATSAEGRIHIFSDDGSDRREIIPGFNANMIRIGKLSNKDATVTIFAAGASPAGNNALRLSAFTSDGAQKWVADLPSTNPSSDYSAALATGKPWIALGLITGQVFVVDATNGTILGSLEGQGSAPEVAWVADKDTSAPLLIVSSQALRAYRVKQP